jgi:hypothetical protein
VILPPVPVADLLRAHPLASAWDLETVRTIPARHSRLVEYRDRATGRALIAKTIVRSTSPEHGEAVLAREFATITRLRATLPASLRDTLPEPLVMLPGHYTFVMSKVPGRSLAVEIKQRGNAVAFWRWHSLEPLARRTGAWLRHFHAATERPTSPFDPDLALAAIEQALGRCAEFGWTSGQAEGVRRGAREAATAEAGQPVACAARHGDFVPQNVMVDGDAVRMVDFESFAESDAVYEDVCSFTAYLAMLESSPLYSARILRAMRSGFLAGYGGTLRPRLMALHETRLSLTVLAEFLRRPAGRFHRMKLEGLERRVLEIAGGLQRGAAEPRMTPHPA